MKEQVNFACSCGAKFSEFVKPGKLKSSCIKCKGIAKKVSSSGYFPLRAARRRKTCPHCGNEIGYK